MALKKVRVKKGVSPKAKKSVQPNKQLAPKAKNHSSMTDNVTKLNSKMLDPKLGKIKKLDPKKTKNLQKKKGKAVNRKK